MEIRGGNVLASKSLKRASRGAWIVFIAVVVYTIVIGGLSVQRYNSYNAGMYDLGIMEQTIWNTAHGRFLTTSVNKGYPVSRVWNGRWELIYLPIAFLQRVFPNPATSLIFQTILLAIGAVPIYLLAVEKVGKGVLSVSLPMAYLLYPPLHNANLFDVHGITMATPMVLFAFYFLQKRAMKPFYIFLALLLLCRDDASFVAFMLGLYAFIMVKERRGGIFVMVLSSLWFLLIQNFHYLRPLFDLPPLSNPDVFPSRWEGVGGSSPASFVASIIGDPLGFLQLFWDSSNLKLIVKLFAPVGFLSWLSPSSFALMMPNLVINMISSSPVSKDIYHHYTSAVTPVVFISAVMGTAYLLSAYRSRSLGRHAGAFRRIIHPGGLSIGILSLSVLASVLWSRIPEVASHRVTSHHRVNDRMADTIPQEASVSAHFFLGPHVAYRQDLFLFPDKLGEAEYVFYDLTLPYNRLMSHKVHSNPAVNPVNVPFLSLLDDRRYGIVNFEDGTIIFKKGADYQGGLRTFGSKASNGNWDRLNDIDLGAISLVGIRKEGISGYTEKLLHIVLYWRWNGGNITDDFSVALSVSGNGNEQRLLHRPFFGKIREVNWERGEIIRDDLFFPITGLRAGSFQLQMAEETGDGEGEGTRHLIDITISPGDITPRV